MTTVPRLRRARLIPFAAAATVLVTVLTGCGHADSTTPSATAAAVDTKPATGDVTIWAPDGDATALDDVLKPFKADNPDATVTVTLIPSSEYNTKLQTAIAAGTQPDISFVYTEAQTQFLASGAFAPVPDDLVDSTSFFPGSWSAGEYDGATYSVPWYAYTRVLIYRKDFADKAGATAPATWDDLVPFYKSLEQGGAVSAAGGDVAWDTYTGQDLAVDAFQIGKSMLSDDGKKWDFDNADMIKATEYYTAPFTEGLSELDGPGFLDAQPYLVAGKTGSVISGPWVISGTNDVAKDDTWADEHLGTAVLPAGTAGSIGALAGGSWAVSKDSKSTDAAWKVIRFLAQTDTQVAQYKAAGSMPAVQAAWQDSSIADQPLLDAFFEQLKNVQPMPQVTTWTQVSTILGQEMELVARGKESAADAMKNVQAQADSIGVGE